MGNWKKEYEEIKVPENMKERMEASIERAKMEKRKVKKVKLWKTCASAAAVLAIVLVLPNTSQTAAAAMQQIPLLGNLFKITTVREYQVDEERNMANVKVPQVEVQDATEGNTDADRAAQAKESADAINFDIEEETNKLIDEFKESMKNEEGYQDIYIDSKVLTDNDRLFSLELILYQGAGSGYEQHKHYTVDKRTGKELTLKDLCGDDYVNTISEEVKEQMRAQMAADETVKYWLDDPDVPEWNFDKIAEDQDFYVNAEGHVVICFNEYDVAPGSMGCVEFIMPQTVTLD
ncbi:DUF3298 domain-containing protein [Clostridiaceae bacterium Marseille-Q4145]|nr:DUF3298 domain-containing protein [Clostridiaceae bacterium Marseille-Q4145]